MEGVQLAERTIAVDLGELAASGDNSARPRAN